jgi:acyl-CoA thioesterase FadM
MWSFDARTCTLRSAWQLSWRQCGTAAQYCEALLQALDEAKDLFLSLRDDPLALGSSAGNSWVVRAHAVLLAQPLSYHHAHEFKTRAEVRTRVTRLGTTSILTEQEVWHEHELLAACRSTIVLVHEDGSPRPLAGEQRSALAASLAASLAAQPPGAGWNRLVAHAGAATRPDLVARLLGRELPDNLSGAGSDITTGELVPRPSDQDALNHVNNCRMALFVSDARAAARPRSPLSSMPQEQAFVYGFARPLVAGARYRVQRATWLGLEVTQVSAEKGEMCFEVAALKRGAASGEQRAASSE